MTIGAMTRRYGFHFVSLVAVVVFMIVGFSPMLAVFYSTVLAFALSSCAGDRHPAREGRCLARVSAIAVVLQIPGGLGVFRRAEIKTGSRADPL